MGLKDTIRLMLKYADKRPGEPVRQRLAKGLEIAVIVEGQMVRLQLSRNDIFPSSQEWRTVVSCWPDPILIKDAPKSIKTSSAYFLQGILHRNYELLKGNASGGDGAQ